MHYAASNLIYGRTATRGTSSLSRTFRLCAVIRTAGLGNEPKALSEWQAFETDAFVEAISKKIAIARESDAVVLAVASVCWRHNQCCWSSGSGSEIATGSDFD